MPRKVHVSTSDASNNKSLRVAVGVTLIAGLTLILLSMAVFSLAATTRSLSSDAERLHTADEALRAATTARAQLALGLHGSRVDSIIGSDSSASVSASVNEAELALDGFAQSVDLLDSSTVNEPADRFLESAAASASSIRVPTSDEERDLIDESLDISYSSLIEQLTNEREQLLASVAEADRNMGTLGNLASFVVAFLLPTSAIFIYRQLARRPRRQVELEHELAVQRKAEKSRAESLRIGLAEFNEQIDQGNTQGLVAEARRLSTVNALNYGQHTYDVARIPFASALSQIADNVDNDTLCEVNADDLSILVDQDALDLAVGALIDSARSRGAARIRLLGKEAPASAKIEVLTDAETLAPLVARTAFLEATELTSAADQRQRELLLARTLLEGMGARIAYQASDVYEKFEITVPRAAQSTIKKTAAIEALTTT